MKSCSRLISDTSIPLDYKIPMAYKIPIDYKIPLDYKAMELLVDLTPVSLTIDLTREQQMERIAGLPLKRNISCNS